MDPVDQVSVQQLADALARPGTLLSCQQMDIGAVGESLDSLHVGLIALATEVQRIQETRPAAPPIASSESCIQPPGQYDGEPGLCRAFFSQCSLAFEFQPSAFPSEHSKVVYITMALTGSAREWAPGTPLLRSVILMPSFKRR